nr:hypothetical protein [Tanacetum cinerariifolium]
MFKVVKKLKGLKKSFRKLLFDQGNIHDNVTRLRLEVDQAQKDLDLDPFNPIFRDQEANSVNKFNESLVMQEHFLKQRDKILWLKEGDSNTTYFYKAVKSRISRSQIDVITNSNGIVFENEQVASDFVDHYVDFLGSAGNMIPLDTHSLFDARLTDVEANHMIRDITSNEVKEAMFSMGNDKSPGPDGYTAAFFKEAWDIVGPDIVLVVREFFGNGKLLKELNHTVIALIPKSQTPTIVNDYRPISCCNVLFKCISKVIANRIKGSLKNLISQNQSAFVPGRSISDNALLTYELMHNYHLDRGMAWCAFKVDIQKAYDTVDWMFLKEVLIGFGFHVKMVEWIMECFTTTSFSININGALHGYFKDLELINLCFADDLFLFSHGDDKSAKVIMEALEEFKLTSALVLSLQQRMHGFLWCQGKMRKVKSKVAWEVVWLPKKEGGLGVKRLDIFNKALMSSHIWKLLIRKDSLWVKWIHTYKIRECNFWDIPCRGTLSWACRKILQLRPLIHKFIWYKLGNGQSVSFWYDNWCSLRPLADLVSTREMYRAGLTTTSKSSNHPIIVPSDFDNEDAFSSTNSLNYLPEISPPKDVETPVESSIPVSPSSSVNLHYRLARLMGSKPVLEKPNESDDHLWK